MKTVFATALVTFASAGKVHPSFAESNFICNLCKDVVKHAE
jgi:hypothetical protein